jgi:hypothetical protein
MGFQELSWIYDHTAHAPQGRRDINGVSSNESPCREPTTAVMLTLT